VNLKKRALPLAVAVGVIGGALGIAAPAANAATALPDTCATYLQGTIDPLGGPLPGSIIPLNPPANNHVYGVAGHLAKGQDKVLNDLNNNGLGAKRFSASLQIGGTITGNTAVSGPNAPVLQTAFPATTDAVTSIKLGWANDTTVANTTKFATIQVAESSKLLAQKVAVAKGVINGAASTDDFGATLAVKSQGVASTSSEVANLVVPKEATGGSYQLRMSFPAFAGPPLGGVTLTTPAIAYNATAATVQGTWNAVTTGAGIGNTVTVTGTNFSGTTDGDYTLTFGGAFTNQNIPDMTVVDPQVGNLATTLLSDGSIGNSKRAAGGRDPSISTIADLGASFGAGSNIYAATGTMSSGPVGGTQVLNGKNTGKAGFYSDTQMTFIQYPTALVTAINPNLAANGALPILSAITGIPVPQLQDNCSLAGLLVVFCVANAAVIPATFAGLCGAITTP